MKKIVSIVTFSVLVFWINIKTSYSEEKYFVVTAYYSPLPDQDYYMRGTLEKMYFHECLLHQKIMIFEQKFT